MDIRYNSSIIPDWNKKDIIHTGANCQVYAYEILRFNNKNIPDYRSSELWEDTLYSSIVSSEYHPWDILFFNKNNDPYGAHLGIYLWDNKILHNSKDIWKPAISELNDFKKIEKYKCLIWAKRFRDI
jgi:lipoprotein Spr